MAVILAALALVISLSSHSAGATPVSVRLEMTYVMQCGWPGPTIDVVFPSTERLPARIPRTAVLVDGKRAAAVSHTGRTVAISVAHPTGVQCLVIAPGTVTVDFTRVARLGNPLVPGTYRLLVRHAGTVLHGRFSVQ